MYSSTTSLPENYNPLLLHHHIKFLQWTFSSQPENLNLIQRFEIQKRLNRILPLTVSFMTWFTLLPISLWIDFTQNLGFVTMLSGIFIWLLAFLVTVKYATVWKSGLQTIVAFCCSSLLQSKILYWKGNPLFCFVFVTTRCLEMFTLFCIAARYSSDFSYILRYFISICCSQLSLLIVLVRKLVHTKESSNIFWILTGTLLTTDFSIVMHFYFTKLAKQQQLDEPTRYKNRTRFIGLLLFPFGISTFFNWLYYVAFFFDIVEPIDSFENGLVVFIVGLVIMTIFYILKEGNFQEEVFTKRKHFLPKLLLLSVPLAEVCMWTCIVLSPPSR